MPLVDFYVKPTLEIQNDLTTEHHSENGRSIEETEQEPTEEMELGFDSPSSSPPVEDKQPMIDDSVPAEPHVEDEPVDSTTTESQVVDESEHGSTSNRPAVEDTIKLMEAHKGSIRLWYKGYSYVRDKIYKDKM